MNQNEVLWLSGFLVFFIPTYVVLFSLAMRVEQLEDWRRAEESR